MFSAAFDKPVYGEGKYCRLTRAPLHLDVPMYRSNIRIKPAGLVVFFRSF